MSLDTIALGIVGLYAWSQGFYFLGSIAFAIGIFVVINELKNP